MLIISSIFFDFHYNSKIKSVTKSAARHKMISKGGKREYHLPYPSKEFLTFMMSDEGLRIYYEATGGGILPMKPSDGVYPTVQMSTFRRNQMEIFEEDFLVNLSKAGTNRLYSIAGVSTTYNNGLMGVPGVLLRTSNGTITERVNKIMSTNQQTVSNKWSSIEPLL